MFVPSLSMFTVTPTCDYCIHVMSIVSRFRASLPFPYHFGPKSRQASRKRRGLGSSIVNHSSFLRVVNNNRLSLPLVALRFKELMALAPRSIFIVDFETVRRTRRGLPLIPIEITVRDGLGNIIVNAVINDDGCTNAEFELNLRKLGFTDKVSFSSVRRIRGSPTRVVPEDTLTSTEVLDVLIGAGLPGSLWVEYSSHGFDYRCMEVLIQRAGYSSKSIFPPRESCWSVMNDFARSLPGK